MSGISYTLSGVSSIETRHSFAIAGWQSVNYDLKGCMIYRMVIHGLQEVIHGQTPLIVPKMEGSPGQKLKDRTTRIEEFKR